VRSAGPPSWLALLLLLAAGTSCADDGRQQADGSDGAGAADRGLVDGDAQAGAAIGAPCGQDTDCSGGQRAICLDEDSFGQPGGNCTQLCDTDLACPQGAECLILSMSSLCMRLCTHDTDCRAGYHCADGVLGETLTAGRVCAPGRPDARPGDPCLRDTDCAPGRGVCFDAMEFGYPEGYCSLGCVPGDGAGCGDGATCVSAPNGGLCAASCDPAHGCRDGYSCVDSFDGQTTGGATVCAPGLSQPVPVGSPCIDASGCTAGTSYCIQATDGLRDGYCSANCDPGQAESCGAGAICQAVGGADPSAGFCLASCQADSDCEMLRGGAGYGCSARAYGRGVPSGSVCLPFTDGASTGDPCATLSDCALGGICIGGDQGFDNGYCSSFCDPSDGPAGCDASSLCWVPLTTDPTKGYCVKACSQDDQCRTAEQYSCKPVAPMVEQPTACFPQYVPQYVN
jgi:hypothetical protein